MIERCAKEAGEILFTIQLFWNWNIQHMVLMNQILQRRTELSRFGLNWYYTSSNFFVNWNQTSRNINEMKRKHWGSSGFAVIISFLRVFQNIYMKKFHFLITHTFLKQRHYQFKKLSSFSILYSMLKNQLIVTDLNIILK